MALHAVRVQPLRADPSSLALRRSVSAHISHAHSTGSASSPADAEVSVLHLSPTQFTLVWMAYVTVTVLNATLTLVFAAIYYGAYSIRGGYMIESVGLLSLAYIPIVIACYTGLALVYGRIFLQTIVWSIRARRLTLSAPSSRPTGTTSTRSCWPRRVLQRLRRHVPFEVSFLVRELLEVSTQSYQVYKCSTLISIAWINDFYVSTLVLNCWIAPVIHVAIKQHQLRQRFFYICSDIMLDFASTFVIPVSIISTVVLKAFQDNLGSASGDMEYAFDVPMGDVALSNMVKAVQQVFVVSWIDFVTKLLPFISMALCLNQIKQFVLHCPRLWPRKMQHAHTHPIRKIASQPKDFGRASLATVPIGSRPRRWTRAFNWAISARTVHVLFVIWGACVVGFHLQTENVASRVASQAFEGCKTSSHPWFVDKLSCTVLEINCHRRGVVGTASEIASALNNLDPNGVSWLIITHCPQLSIPPEILTLRNMMGLEIFNTTLVEWGESAALTDSKLPVLQYLTIARVNMSELPIGLQSAEFPTRLRDVTMSITNITTLPTNLHTKWKRMLNLVIERSLLEVAPSTIAQMNPSRFSVFNNRITNIPDNFFSRDASFWIFSIAKNPVKKLPSTIGSLSSLYLVLIDYTEIAELPRWLMDEGERRAESQHSDITISAGGSPFCKHRSSGDPQPLRGLHIVCREKKDEEIEAYMVTFYEPVRQP